MTNLCRPGEVVGLSIDVRLPKDQVPKFPDRCVVCGREKPDGTVRVGTRAIGWWTWAFWVPGRKFALDVPACSWCAARLRRGRLFRWLTLAALALAAVFTIAPFFEGVPRPLRRWLVLGAVIVVLLPWFTWEVMFPPPIDLTAYGDAVDYEFRDRAYAEEFAALNNATTDADSDDSSSTAEQP